MLPGLCPGVSRWLPRRLPMRVFDTVDTVSQVSKPTTNALLVARPPLVEQANMCSKAASQSQAHATGTTVSQVSATFHGTEPCELNAPGLCAIGALHSQVCVIVTGALPVTCCTLFSATYSPELWPRHSTAQ